MPLAQTVQVLEEEPDQEPRTITADDLELDDDGFGLAEDVREEVAAAGCYANGTEFDLRAVDDQYSFPKFVANVAEQEGIEHDGHADARLLHREEFLDDPEYGADYGLLLVWPDETLMFVGSDPTATGPPWFAYTIGAHEPIPAPSTAQDALDRLKPAAVRDVIHDDGFVPQRHGEWWLRPTQLAPAGTVFRPGVSRKPYGPSPLGNHVPTEWGMSVTDQEFMDRARDAADLPSSVGTPPEVLEWAVRQINKDELTWHDVRQWADDVLVRGTVRHRDHDHPVEKLGDRWHTAETHDIEVYTSDDITGVHLDYHGG